MLHDAPPAKVQPKRPHKIEVCYPFSSDRALQEQYRNPWGAVRIGKLLEDLDSMAGTVAYQHCDDGDSRTRLPLLVTASVDAIKLRTRLDLSKDMHMSGAVVWTGRSAMDIEMQLRQDGPAPSMVSLFTFVARNPVDGRSTPINPLQPQTPEEQRLYDERQSVAQARRQERRREKEGVTEEGPSKAWAEGLLDKGRILVDMPSLAQPNAMLMSDTALQNTFTCQPQQRNIHGRVFGGFLMRRAYELAFANAYMFAGTRPIFHSVDEVSFVKPVDVGDLLRFRSRVIHTQQPAQLPGTGLIHVEVVATVTQPELVQSHQTNTFYMIFQANIDPSGGSQAVAKPAKVLKSVLPATAEEARLLWDFYYC